jgi:putative redox protein
MLFQFTSIKKLFYFNCKIGAARAQFLAPTMLILYFYIINNSLKMEHKINASWQGNMKFDALVSGHTLSMDAMPEVGGENSGPRPKELMLASLAGCTGMDVVSILKKMKVELDGFDIEVKANLTDEHPKHYTSMHVIYKFKGNGLDVDKLKKAVELSQDKYCGVSAAYRKAMALSYEIVIA